ncbi:MAG: T9SS C-terminal target domain-containing protein [Bacteroidetes bacterium]|nr:T9SS C-terminal target domain-containing protein [Bacteroidota bacterium]MCW5894107.1 T9SS C-terminal target domain-containing protein [Bacteroidota bacterium]
MHRFIFFILIFCVVSTAFPQRDYRTHRRGMLHHTVYNTGELGRVYDNGVGSILPGFSSMEWPPNSSMILNRVNYRGQHNAFGGGLWLAGTRPSGRQYVYCGAVSDANGNATTLLGVSPISIERIENYPILENGRINLAYNPDEAEERIVAKWGTQQLGIVVTRTSRTWSFPGYDSFIIYEYELENTTADTIKDLSAVWTYALGPSMFGYQRTYNRWGEGDYRGQNGEGNQFGRFDLKRWMTYNHDREGRPDTAFFNQWSQPGDRGGLNSPQAAGMMMLYYDYERVARKNETQQIWLTNGDSSGAFDINNKIKQPFMLRYENGNLPATKNQPTLDPLQQRRTGVFQGTSDSLRFRNQLIPFDPANWTYWKGRTRGSTNLSWYQPVVHMYGFFPFTLPPGETIRFAVADVVGYGPGVAGDRIYSDLGGNIRAGVDAGTYFCPIPSWYDTLQYPFLGPKPYIGSTYLQNNPLPWYVTPGVVSIRDVADRAIEMYTGLPLAKYDSLQYEPADSTQTMLRQRKGRGYYNTVPIPVPAPALRVEDTRSAYNKLVWYPYVEDFTNAHANGRLRASFMYYLAMRATSPLGPWAVMDTIHRSDQRFFEDSIYTMLDTNSVEGSYYYYAVVSVDSSGGRSGMTNMRAHLTQAPPVAKLSKVYVVPNPLFVTNPEGGFDARGDVADRIKFRGLTARCTIRIYSYSGQLVQTIEHDGSFGEAYFQISRNNQLIASGVYYFVVEDESGARTNGKFVIVH